MTTLTKTHTNDHCIHSWIMDDQFHIYDIRISATWGSLIYEFSALAGKAVNSHGWFDLCALFFFSRHCSALQFDGVLSNAMHTPWNSPITRARALARAFVCECVKRLSYINTHVHLNSRSNKSISALMALQLCFLFICICVYIRKYLNIVCGAFLWVFMSNFQLTLYVFNCKYLIATILNNFLSVG